jgi:integrase
MAKNKTLKGTRRKNGEGSIYQEKDGRWVGAVRMEQDDGTRIRKKVYGKSRTEVSKKLVALTGRMSIVKNSNLTNKTFGELFKEWLLIFKQSAVAPRTFEGNFRNYNIHIKPYVGKMKIEDITTPVVQQVINELLAKGLSTNTVKKVKFLFNQFFEYAVDCEWVLTNPTLRVKIRSRDIKLTDSENEYKAIKPEMRMKFISALNNNSFLKPLCMTAMFAGLRIGEILALRWENIDFENNTISVLSSITRIPTLDEDGKILYSKTVIGKTKTTCSVREVPIPDILVEALQDWKKEQWVKEQLSNVKLLSPESIVFSNTDGSVRTYSGTRMIFNRFAKKYGFFGKVRFHTLRHTYSNMLFEANENPKIIQALLGHKSVKTTLTVYNSIDTSYYREATDKLNKLFNSEKMAEYRELEKKRDIPALKKPIEEIDDIDEDPEIAILEKMLAERRARRKNQDCEM